MIIRRFNVHVYFEFYFKYAGLTVFCCLFFLNSPHFRALKLPCVKTSALLTMISPAWSIFLIGTKIGLFLQVAPLSVMAKPCPSVCRCDAGFIYCNDRFLTSIPTGIPEDATTLYLQNNQINNAGIPSDLKNLLKVERIYLYHNSLDEFPTNLPKYVTELSSKCNSSR